jgi:hypothetical protein
MSSPATSGYPGTPVMVFLRVFSRFSLPLFRGGVSKADGGNLI